MGEDHGQDLVLTKGHGLVLDEEGEFFQSNGAFVNIYVGGLISYASTVIFLFPLDISG